MNFELKYAVPARRADAIAAWLDGRCAPDPQYPEGHIRNLYLDTPGLRFLHEKIDGDFLKAKVRLRWYGANATARAAGPVWLEIKQRCSFSRSKKRIVFHRTAQNLDEADPAGVNIEEVVPLIRTLGFDVPSVLKPSLGLHYTRSRWIEPLTGTRVALDRAIQPAWIRGRARPIDGVELSDAVVEFKGPLAAVPSPLASILRFGAYPTSFSKYFNCYARLSPAIVTGEGDHER